MANKLFIINGAGGSGKDTFVEFIQANAKHPHKFIPIFNFRSSDHTKEVAKLMGWDGEKDDRGRLFLSQLMKASREYNGGVFTHYCWKIKDLFLEYSDIVIFLHVREPDEIKKYVKEFGDICKTVLVVRNEVNQHKNESDLNVLDYDYDLTVDNAYGLDNLELAAINFLNKEIKGENRWKN